MRMTVRGLCALGVVLLALAGVTPAAADEGRATGPGNAGAIPFDFNGDGFADLATGVPGESVGAIKSAGAVDVIYGARTGLSNARAQHWSQSSRGIRGAPEENERFGKHVASGDFDGDGYADLAAAMDDNVAILYGGSGGLTARDQLFSSPDLGDSGDREVESIVAGDFNGDDYTELAIGVSGPGVVELPEVTLPAPAVVVLPGSPAGLTTTGRVEIDTTPPGEFAERFGAAMATGDVTGDNRDDLVVGTGAYDLGNVTIGGFFFVPGSATGLRPSEKRFIGPDSAGVRPPGAVLSWSFGSALAIADFDDDGFEDVAVGDPRGGTDSSLCERRPICAGVVLILRGSADGPSTEGRQIWSLSRQGRDGGLDYEVSNGFGAALAAGDLNHDLRADLAIAAPFDFADLGGIGPGAVYVLYGSERGLTRAGTQKWTQNSKGIKGVGHNREALGLGGLQIHDYGKGAAADLSSHNLFDKGTKGSVNVFYGSRSGLTSTGNQLWHQDVPGIPGRAEATDEFGTATDPSSHSYWEA